MKNISIWKEETKTRGLNNQLENNLKCDILIIGGGITGLSTASYLSHTNKKVVVIDKTTIGKGVTANSTGKLTIMQDVMYSKIMNVCNFDTAYNYYKSQKCALKLVDNMINKYEIDCDYQVSPSITFAQNIEEIVELEKEEKFYNMAKIKYKRVTELENGLPISYGIKMDAMHVFNPLKFLIGLKKKLKDIKIYENVMATDLKKSCGIYRVTTNKGVIYSKKVVVATHYPFFIKPGFIPFRTHIEKSYLLAATVDDVYKFNAINSGSKVTSIRYYHNYMIMANNSHTTTDKDNYRKNFKLSCDKFTNCFKGLIVYAWSNHDVMTNDYLPYIGEIDRNLFMATGYNKWGLATGVLAGKIISDKILNKKNQYSKLFSLNRKGSLTKTMIAFNTNLTTAKTYMKLYLVKKHQYRIINQKINNKDIITYKVGKKEYSVYNRCPHMGCKLLFNEKEKTWDCPCHGSRFDLRGKCIFGPSTYSISID